MSFQAMTWAIEQKTGSPRAKCILLSVANYANPMWCAYPKQELIARESEQSTDSVQRYLADLIEPGLIRRIKLKRFGRRTHDFLILRPSPLYEAPIGDILPHLPSGCDVMEDAAADGGSVQCEELTTASDDSEIDAAADGGSVSNATLPPVAVDATALQRQQEPFTNQESLPQTPSRDGAASRAKEETTEASGSDEGFQEILDKYAEHAIAPTCSNPEAARADWRQFTPDQRSRAYRGACGVAAVRRRDPKAKSIVGLNRFLRSEPLWAEYARFAPAAATPAARTWVAVGTDDWRGRAVLYAIIGRSMPPPKTHPSTGELGADFVGALPQAGLVLAPFANDAGKVDRTRWVVLDDDQPSDHQRICAWRDRLNECIGARIEVDLIYFDDYVEMTGLDGRPFQARRRVRGVRVPCDWPPAKGKAVAA